MKLVKKIIAATLLITLELSTKINSRKTQEKIKFALIPKLTTNPFFTVAQEGCSDKASELNIECVYIGPETEDQTVQNSIIKELVRTRSIQGISVSVSDAEQATEAINEAIEAGIPVITFDSDAPQSNRISYIGTDNLAFGELLAKTLLLVDPEGGLYGKYAFVSGAGPNLAQRVRGFRKALESFDSFKSSWTEINQPPTDSKDQTSVALEQCHELADNPEVRAIVPVGGWPMWDPVGWKDFVDTYRAKNKNLTLVVADALDVQVELMNQGYGEGLVGQLPYEMGTISMETLFDIYNGVTTKQEISGTNLLQVLSVPLDLPLLNKDNNHIGNLRYFGYVLYALLCITALLSASVTILFKNHSIFHHGPVILLLRICVGVTISGSIIITASIDDENYSQHSCDVACNLTPWLVTMGFTIFFSALFTKTWAINSFLQQTTPSSGKIRITKKHKLLPFGIQFSYNFLILLCMSTINPLTFVRVPEPDLDSWNRVIETTGLCFGENKQIYISMILTGNFAIVAIANLQVFQATKTVALEANESQYLQLAQAAILQALILGTAMLVLTNTEPRTFYVVISMAAFLTLMAVLLLIFVPRILYLFTNKDASGSINTSINATNRNSSTLAEVWAKRRTSVENRSVVSSVHSSVGNQDGLKMTFDKAIVARFASSEEYAD